MIWAAERRKSQISRSASLRTATHRRATPRTTPRSPSGLRNRTVIQVMKNFFQCPFCNYPCEVTLRTDTPHYGEIRCPEHGHAWVPKPNSEKNKKRKVNAHLKKYIPESYQGFCELCLRSKSLLMSLKPSLSFEVHHVIPHEDGGSDNSENLRLLCSECHQSIHARRRSFNRYQSHAP